MFNHPVNRFVARYAGIKNFFRATFITSYNTFSGITENRTKFRLPKADYPSSGLLIIGSSEVLLSRQGAAGIQMNNIRGVIDDIVPSATGYEISVSGRGLLLVWISLTGRWSRTISSPGEKVIRFIPHRRHCVL
ncbi:MAG: hypothetical protein MZV63_32485 [Marinilabiliales bacterium]|nr:hypothetical protein [Marinilabiliales bacterium]